MVLTIDGNWFREKKITYKKLQSSNVDEATKMSCPTKLVPASLLSLKSPHGLDQSTTLETDSGGWPLWNNGTNTVPHKIRIALGAGLSLEEMKAATSLLPSANQILSALWKDKPALMEEQFKSWCNNCIFYYLVHKNAGIRCNKRSQCSGLLYLGNDDAPFACCLCWDCNLLCSHTVTFKCALNAASCSCPILLPSQDTGASNTASLSTHQSVQHHTLALITKKEIESVTIAGLSPGFGSALSLTLLLSDGSYIKFGAVAT
ncbi:hypothetical protein CALCODRAFT_512837 [Calocera cornea HHB12733]|uniref:Uncharacterized protein n=1 Tax=Calocera cornea HHB12733 TaxID=1353952 RepID=A0A165CQX7_9BASI|nr:hypothetical protein CALCODRAFT_512837 [Calocera cornea HHB12733]